MPHKSTDDWGAQLPDFTEVLAESKEIIRECFTKFKLEEVFLSFNGGKDCTVLLDIVIDVLKQIHNAPDVARQIKAIYVRTNGPFKEIEEFVKKVEDYYSVKLVVTEGEMKETLQRLLVSDSNLKACLMGTRKTDPYSENLSFIQKTDPGWPQLMRVSPLLNWSYHQIWSYIRQRDVPYCVLYDKGYTSIGSIHNTRPNPSLLHTDSLGRPAYLPAWRLTDGATERAGRFPAKPNQRNCNAEHINSL